MTRLAFIILFVGTLAACARPATTAETPHAASKKSVELRRVAEGVFIHRSWSEVEGFGLVPANGLVVATEGGALLIDTPWTAPITKELLDRVEAELGEVRAVIVTHWHDDRTGGLAEAHRRRIPSFGEARTLRDAQRNGEHAPRSAFDGELDLGRWGVEGEARHLGAGHSRDNVVVYVEKQKVLFGGCLIKSAEAKQIGNTSDADLDAWPETVRRVRDKYAQAEMIIPGHGEPGGDALYDRTLELLETTERQ